MKKLAVVLVLFFGICHSAFAEEIEIDGEEFYNSTAQEIVNGELVLSPAGIMNAIIDGVFGEILNVKSMLKSILLIAVSAGLLRVLSEAFGTGETSEAAFFACFALMSGVSISVFSEAVGYGTEVVHGICDFITKFEPVFIGLLVSGGAITQAAAFQPVLAGSVFILGLLIDKCILPLIYFSAVLGVVNNIGGRVEIGTLNKLLNQTAKWI